MITIEDEENFEDGDCKRLMECIEEQINDNLGTVMLFSVISTAQEWLNVQWDRIKLQREERIAKKLQEEEEAELVCTTNCNEIIL